MEFMTKITGLNGTTARVILCVMACVPFQAFAGSSGSHDQENRFYFSGNYKSSFPNFGSLDVKESESHVPGVMTQTKMSMRGGSKSDISDARTYGPYRPPYYENNFFGFAGSVGFAVGAMRVELEGTRNEFEVGESAYMDHSDGPSYTALVRGKYISQENYVVVRNKKVGIDSVSLNICYDIKANTDPVVSYLCLGLSGNVLDLLDTRKLVHGYHGKIGVGLNVTPKVLMFVGGYYHALHGSNFDSIKLIIPENAKLQPQAAYAQAKMSISYLGGEIGLRYAF